MVLPFTTASQVKARYPGQWTITNAPWGCFTSKVYGPYICMALSLKGQQTRWRMKELKVSMDDGDLIKNYRTVSAGRALNIMEAIKHMEENRLPSLLSAYQYRMQLREQVVENVG